MNEWQPIETAPKDRYILVYPPTYSNTTCSIAIWDEDQYSKKPRPFWRRIDTQSMRTSRYMPVKQWMPLPEPPK